MKTFIITLLSGFVSLMASAQSINGSWQLVKQTICVENNALGRNDSEDSLVYDMKMMTDKTPQIINFSDHLNGEESTKILSSRKSTNSKHFLYKFDGANLYILDKKSRTITDTYIVDTFEGDNLILSNSAHPCETKVFVRIKQ